MRTLGCAGSLVLILLAPAAFGFKAGDFKTCSQSGFCRRGRALASRAANFEGQWTSPYTVDEASVSVAPNQASFTAAVKSSLYPEINFELDLRVHEDGVVRVRMDEVGGLRKRYDETASWALVAEPRISQDIAWTVGNGIAKAVYGENKDIQVTVDFNPFKVTLFRGGHEQVVLNGLGLLHMEHFRIKEETPAAITEETVEGGEASSQTAFQVNTRAWFEGETEDDWWEEKFSTWTDTKPKGKYAQYMHIDYNSI
jgi:mannosyl-oligosaccharide alpha-1,3-glucosidase